MAIALIALVAGVVLLIVFLTVFGLLLRLRDRLQHVQRGAREAAEATRKPADAAPTIQVQGATRSERCPYCHTDVVEAEVTCAECLARHHRECWDEHQECASCGAVERYTGVERTKGRERSEPTKEK